MRTGAIFARGSCRALKWVALLGVVYALGAGQAAAQVTVTGPAMDTVMEGGIAEYDVAVKGFIPTTGSAGTVTVTLATPTPDSDATVAGEPSDLSVGNSVLTFTADVPAAKTGATAAAPFSATGTIRVRTVDDDDAEDEKFTLAFTAGDVAGLQVSASDPTAIALVTTGEKAAPTALTIDDDETQNYVLDVTTEKPMEGEPVVATLVASPMHEDGSSVLMLEIDPMGEMGYSLAITDDSDAEVTGTSVTIGEGGTEKATITITTPTNDKNRIPNDIKLMAYTSTGGVRMQADEETITVADAHPLPMLGADVWLGDDEVTSGMVDEGEEYTIRVYPVDDMEKMAEAKEEWTVTLMGSGAATAGTDYMLAEMATIPMGKNMTGSARLTVTPDDDIEGNESLMIMATVKGGAANGADPSASMTLLDLTVNDMTMAEVRVLAGAEAAIEAAMNAAKGSDGKLNPDDDFSVMKSKLFAAAESYSMRVDAQSSKSAVATVDDSGDNITVMPEAAGETMITVTATAIPPDSFTGRNLSPSVAEITFDVMVEAAAVTVAAPGAPTDLTATAGDKQVALAWKAPTSGDAATGYEFRYGPGTFRSEWDDTDSMTAHTVTGLDNGTEYTFEVRATNAGGEGDAASAKATPMAPDPGVQVVVKEVKVNTSVPESGGLEVSVVATVPAGTKVDGKVAPIASRMVTVDPHVFTGEGIGTNEEAEAEDVRVLTSPTVWKNITRTDKDSEQTYKFRLAIGQDLDAEDEKFRVSVSIDGAAKMSKVITIDDAQEQSYDLSLPSAAKGAIKEGSSGTLTLKAVPAKTFNIPVTLALNPNDPSKYTLSSPSSDMFGVEAVTASVSAKADGDRSDDTITVSAYTKGTLGNDVKIAELDITITDINALPAVKATLVDDKGKALDPQPKSVMEGDTVKIMLTAVDKDGKAIKAAEKLSVSLMPSGSADSQDYRLSTHPIEIAKGKESSAAVGLTITEDQDVGAETLMFDAAVGGESKIGSTKRSVPGVLSLMIEDGTKKLVWANSEADVEAAITAAKKAGMGDDMVFSAGEMIEVMSGLLFSSGEGVSVSYTAESDKGDVASASVDGSTVMVTAKSAGMAHITITAHANMPSGVTIHDQNDPRMASISFPIEVGLVALTMELSGPDDMMHIVEGGMAHANGTPGSAMITVKANRAVTEAVTVNLMIDRTMSGPGLTAADFEVEAITIAAGQDSGSTMLTAVADDMDERMEELVLYGMAADNAGEVTGDVKLYIWDAAVPALPIIAQLLLAGLLAVGGYRRYRRR